MFWLLQCALLSGLKVVCSSWRFVAMTAASFSQLLLISADKEQVAPLPL